MFKVYTANYESTGLVQAMRFHMESVHCNVVPPPAGTKREKAEDIDKSCIPKIEKGLHETTREEWRQWVDMWSWWRSKQPPDLDMTTILMGRFPKISAELASTRGNREYDEESLLKAIEKLAVKKTNVIRLQQAMRTLSQAYDESITTYAKRLGKAAVACDFLNTATCPSCNHKFQQSYMNEEIRDTFFCGLYDKEMLEKLCMQFQDMVPSLQEIVNGSEGIEASRISAACPVEATVSAISTYKKNSKSEQRKMSSLPFNVIIALKLDILAATAKNQTSIRAINARNVERQTTTSPNADNKAHLRRRPPSNRRPDQFNIRCTIRQFCVHDIQH